MTAALALEKGTRVYWIPDGEEGTVAVITPHACAVRWDHSGCEWYPLYSGSLDRIAPFYPGEEKEGWR